jgi:hypothetical protein
MAKKWSRRECFEHFGAICANERWSWSAKSPDGNTVVMTMWQDEITSHEGKLVYESRTRSKDRKLPGATERLANLKWARAHCNGLVRAVIAVAKDLNAHPRSARLWFPQDGLIMKIADLNESTGAFRAESVKATETRD